MDSERDVEGGRYPKGSWVGVGMALGLSIGAAVGLAMDNLAMGAGLGLLGGVVIGAAIEARRGGPEQ